MDYKVAVSLILNNGVSPVLAVIGRELVGLNSKIKDVEKSFGAWAGALGASSMIIGGAMLGGMAKLVEHGRELVHQQELMKIAGMDNKEIVEATAKAYDVSAKVQTTTISENLQHMRELRYAFGNTETAGQYIEQVSKANAVLNSVKGGGSDQVWDLVKSLEQKGETVDSSAFMRYVDLMTQAVISSGGKVTPAHFMSTFKYGRTAMLGWDETFVGQYLPRLIQSMSAGGGGGGSGQGGPGNALMSAFAKVVQGQMPKTAAEEFERLGLGTAAHIKGSAESQMVGGIKGADLFQKNPYEWVQSVLMPALSSKGITSQEDIISELSRLFPVRTASQIIAEMALQGRTREGANSPFEKDAALARAAQTTEPAYGELIKNDPTTIMKAFHEQWKALLEALGSPLVAPAMEVMKNLTGMITSVSQFAGAHPETIKLIAEAVAALAAALVAIGAVAVGAVVVSIAGLPGIIAAAVAALGTLAALEWHRITEMFDGIKNAISGFVDALAGIWGKVKGLFSGIGKDTPDQVFPGGTMRHKSSFDPGTGGPVKAQPISLSLNLDGRTLAQAVADQLDSLYRYDTNTPAFNGAGRYEA